MAGTVKKLQFSEGTDVGAPTDLSLATSTTSISEYVDDAAYVSANGAASAGDIYINSTSKLVRYYTNSGWRNAVDETASQTVSGKVLSSNDIDGSTASNTSRLTVPKASTATISGLTRKQATLLYDSTLDILQYDNGSSLNTLATTAAAQDSPLDLNNYTITASVGSSALTVALKTKSGSNPSGGDPVSLAFRSATAATGDYTVVTATSSTSVVVSSGSTLGHTSNVASYIYVYAINNAGSIELAVSSNRLDIGTVQSSTAEGGAGAADSATVLYSTTARTSKAIRLLARLTSTQTTAGTWAAVPTEISLGNDFYNPPTSMVQANNPAAGASGFGSTNTRIRIFGSNTVTGSDIIYATSATLGDTFTINAAGIYSVEYIDSASGSNQGWGISVNGTVGTDIDSLTNYERRAIHVSAGAQYGMASCVIRCAVGDVIRGHVLNAGKPAGSGTGVSMIVTQVTKF